MSVLSRLLHGESSHDVTVEAMRRRHLNGVMEIENVSYPRPWSRKVFQSELELAHRGERYYIVARCEGTVIGYAGLMFVTEDAHVTNIAVAAPHQRAGIATRLLAELAWEARRHGSDAMTLEVRVSNTGAQVLYRKFGFVPAGVRQRYYENTEDAIVMWCHDIRGVEFGQRLRQLCPAAESRFRR